ncbi:YHS domain-containing (seleno)protein [Enterovirga aerilata]|uniref:YHS domain-containing protein n=1 Tax=Enterovirga aerilata TaxID=2730920 RepID=A0A849I2N7_9HYPH|nr:YHS domain-containing (seleno)protein [Enterovirga sp. DB1703]NNM73652.1 hypothetical protein [Enterovirga sp. DB1703]
MKSVALSRMLLSGLLLLAFPAASAKPGATALLPEVLGAAEFYAADPLSGLALHGRDPVTYQLEGAPAAGGREHEAVWAGLGWRFATAANRAAFLRSPEVFAPQIGGYDAAAAAEGRLVEADPDIFLVRAGRLYLFRTRAARTRFEADPGEAARAESNWSRLQKVLVRG